MLCYINKSQTNGSDKFICLANKLLNTKTHLNLSSLTIKNCIHKLRGGTRLVTDRYRTNTMVHKLWAIQLRGPNRAMGHRNKN